MLWQALFLAICVSKSDLISYPPMQILNQCRHIFNCIHLLALFPKYLQKKWAVLLMTLSRFISWLAHCLSMLAFFFPSTSPLLFILKILNTWCFFKAASATFIVLPSVRLLSLCSAFDTKLNDQLISLAYLSGCWHWAPSSFCFPVLFLYHSATCVFLWGHP